MTYRDNMLPVPPIPESVRPRRKRSRRWKVSRVLTVAFFVLVGTIVAVERAYQAGYDAGVLHEGAPR